MVRGVKKHSGIGCFVRDEKTIGHRDPASVHQGYHFKNSLGSRPPGAEIRTLGSDPPLSPEGIESRRRKILCFSRTVTIAYKRKRERGPAVFKLWQRKVDRSSRFERTALSESRRSMLLNLLAGILNVFAGTMNRVATNRSEHQREHGKQQ